MARSASSTSVPPCLCELGQGDLRIDAADEGTKHINISGGFAQVLDNQVIVLTEKAEEQSAEG